MAIWPVSGHLRACFHGESRAAFALIVEPPNPFRTKAARADWIDRRLAGLYPETPVPLDHKDAYTLLIAVLLSAQCTD